MAQMTSPPASSVHHQLLHLDHFPNLVIIHGLASSSYLNHGGQFFFSLKSATYISTHRDRISLQEFSTGEFQTGAPALGTRVVHAPLLESAITIGGGCRNWLGIHMVNQFVPRCDRWHIRR